MKYGKLSVQVCAATLCLGLIAGCGGERLYPVEGTVTLEDGKPMPSGMVSFEMQVGDRFVMARGEIAEDGTYQLSSKNPNDGALPGKYRVLVAPPVPFSAAPPPGTPPRIDIDPSYQAYDTSGLTFEVKEEKNSFPIKVARPGKKPR